MRVGKRGALIAAATTILIAVVFRVAIVTLPGSGLEELVPLPLARVTEFALGMCLARALRCGWRPRLRPVVCYISGALAIGGLVVAGRLTDRLAIASLAVDFTNEIMIVLCTGLIVAVATRDVRGGRSILRARLLVVLGELSYSFYLVHATVIYAVLRIVGKQAIGWSNLAWYAAILVLSVGVAAALHYFVEKPLEQIIRTWWNRRTGRRAASLAAEPAGS